MHFQELFKCWLILDTAQRSQPTLTWEGLRTLSQFFFEKGLASSTQSSYASAKKRFIYFCGEFNIEPLPASESKLCRFASKLAADGLSHKTVKCYLSAVSNLHLEYGLDDPGIARMSHLQQIIKGIKSQEAYKLRRQKGHQPRLPIMESGKRSQIMTRAVFCELQHVWYFLASSGQLNLPCQASTPSTEKLTSAWRYCSR